jgi:hypothetical protein
MNTTSSLERASASLKEHGYDAHFEYPGFVGINLPDGYSYAFGTIDGPLGYTVTAPNGAVVEVGGNETIPADAPEDKIVSFVHMVVSKCYHIKNEIIPPILEREVIRTDKQSAREFLGWLAGSTYVYHIDDDPADCIIVAEGKAGGPSFTKEVADLLRERVDECFMALGYTDAWECYPWNKEEIEGSEAGAIEEADDLPVVRENNADDVVAIFKISKADGWNDGLSRTAAISALDDMRQILAETHGINAEVTILENNKAKAV